MDSSPQTYIYGFLSPNILLTNDKNILVRTHVVVKSKKNMYKVRFSVCVCLRV